MTTRQSYNDVKSLILKEKSNAISKILKNQKDYSVYFAYIEDLAIIKNLETIDTINLEDIVVERAFYWYSNQPSGILERVRSCGLLADKCIDKLDKFEPLISGSIIENQREFRRDGILKNFTNEEPSTESANSIKIPVLDFYGCNEDEKFNNFKNLMVEGEWYIIVLQNPHNGEPIIVEELGLYGSFQDIIENKLIYSTSVGVKTSEVLHDIFSLNHVKDADIELDEHSELIRIPQPNNPSLSSSVAIIPDETEPEVTDETESTDRLQGILKTKETLKIKEQGQIHVQNLNIERS